MGTTTNTVQYVLSLKDRLTGSLNSATGATQNLNNKIDQTKSKLKALGGLSSIGGALGLSLGAAGVVSFGKAVVESLKNYEYFSASLRALMKGDALAAKSLETELISLAAKTPFNLTEIQDATKQLIAYGFSAGTVTQNIRMLGEVAAGLKIPFGDIAYLYGTLKTQGIAYTRDINQFTQRGIPITKELASQLGVSDDQIKKMVEDGKIGFPEIEKAFKSMTSEGGMFFNMMGAQSLTVGGKISNMGDSWEQLKVNIGKSQTGIIAGAVSFAGDMISALDGWVNKSNKIHESFANAGINQFSRWQRFAHETIGLVSGYNLGLASIQDIENLQTEMEEKFTNKAKDNLLTSLKLKADLSAKTAAEWAKYRGGEQDFETTQQRVAIMTTSLNEIEGAIRNFKSVGESKKPTAQGANALAAEEKTKAKAPAHIMINVTFGKLFENQIVEVKNASNDFVNRVGDMTAEALLNALNDVSRIPIHAK